MNLFNTNYRIFLLIFLLISLFFFTYHTKNFKLDASSDTLILQNDEDFKYFNSYNKIFPNRNFLVLAIKSQDVIDKDYINIINDISLNLKKIKNIDTVFSIVDAPILLSNNLSLNDLSSFEIENINNSKINLEFILNEFSESPIFKEQIISKDKKTSSIIIYIKENKKFSELKNKRNSLLNNNEKSKKTLKEINSEYKIEKKLFNEQRHNMINEIRNTLKKQNIPYQYFLGGIDMIADDTINFVKKDILVFSITVSFFLILVLFLIFKEIKWVIISLITTSYSIITMIGLNGLLNWEVTAISSNFISLMLILSISMNIHIINYYRINYELNSKDNLEKTFKNMFFPCLYTALTTIVAFGSLIFSDIKPIIDFGKIMMVALTIIFITSFTVLPIIMSFFPNFKDNKNFNLKFLLNFFKSLFNHKVKIIIFNFIILLISFYGITKLNVENSFINYFKKNTEIYKGMKLIDDEMGGTTPLDIIIKFSNEEIKNIDNEITNENDELDLNIEFDDLFNEDDIDSPIFFSGDKIDIIKEIHQYLEKKNEIGKVQSLYSLIEVAERINKEPLSTFELSIIYEQIPEEYKKQLISPYLSVEKNMTKISARIKDSKDIKRNKLIIDIKNDLNNKYTDSIEEVKVNGLLVLYNNMLQSLFSSQIKSFGLVLILIFIMFIILFGSIKLSIVGIIPNIFASSFILGLIGILGIPLDIMTITIAAITIGIAVDNTIHYLYRVRKYYKNKKSILFSLKESHNTVGQAVLTTSITIAFGFSVLCLSNFIPTILFGIFTGLAMIVAMLGVLITVPSLMQIFYNK